MKKSRIITLFVITFAIKFGLILYFTHLLTCQTQNLTQGRFSTFAGDTYSYTGAMDNLAENGKYFFWNGTENVYAGRLPHYAVPYYFLRLVFDKPLAGDLFVIFQILVDVAATLIFAFLCFDIFGKKIAFWIGYALYLCSFNFLITAQVLSPENLSLNLFIFFLYFFHRYWKNNGWKDCFISSVMLALTVVLKPYLVLIYAAFFLVMLRKENVFHEKKYFPFIKKSIILSLPLILLLLPWIVRNAIVLHKFIPAQQSTTAGYNYTDADFAFRRFVGAWGGSIIFWDPSAAACYFDPKPPIPCTFQFPRYAMANGYMLADIEDVRKDYIQVQKQYDPELEKTVVEKFDRLTNIYKSENPLMYHVGSKFLSAKNMLWHTNNNNLPINPGFSCYKSYQMLFKLVQFAVYLLSLTLGLIGLIMLVYKKQASLLFLFVPIYLVGGLSYFGLSEARYFNHAYPVMLIGLTFVFCAISNLLENFYRKSKNSIS